MPEMGRREIGEMPKETIATTDIHNGGEAHTNILKVAWGAKGAHPEAPDGWVNAGYAHIYIGTVDAPFLGSVELGEDECDHLIRVLKRVKRQAFRSRQAPTQSAKVEVFINGAEVVDRALKESLRRQASNLGI